MQYLAADFYIYSESKTLLQKPKSSLKEILLYKTEYCRNWTELGYCRYGEKCRYAHGENELRATPRHVRYKTQICKAYHQQGECPYGLRCTFIHDDPIINNNERNAYSITSPASSTSSLSPTLSSQNSLELNDLFFHSPSMKSKHYDNSCEYSYPYINNYGRN
ncbi:unnamed protein product [Cunninghamella blakesleeana]